MEMDLATLAQVELIPVDTIAADANEASVDLQDYIGRGRITLQAANLAGTNPTMDVKLQDSPDDSTFTDITGAAFVQVTDAAAAFESIYIDTRLVERHVRAVEDIGGTSSPTFEMACVGTFQQKYRG